MVTIKLNNKASSIIGLPDDEMKVLKDAYSYETIDDDNSLFWANKRAGDKIAKINKVRKSRGLKPIPFKPATGIKYIITENGYFSTGQLYKVLSFLNKNNIEFKIEDARKLNKLKIIPQIDFFGFTPLEHQKEAYISIFSNYNLYKQYYNIQYMCFTVDAATNAGKTYIMAMLLASTKTRVLILVTGQDLIRQLYYDLKTLLLPYDKKLGVIGNIPKETIILEDFIIATPKKLKNLIEKDKEVSDFISTMSLVIVDECHEASANDYYKLIMSIPALGRIGLSGTAKERESNTANVRLTDLFGKTIYKIEKKELMEKGVSSNVEVHVYNNSITTRCVSSKHEYDLLIVKSKMKNNVIATICKDTEFQVLISVSTKYHGKYISEFLEQRGIESTELYADSDNRVQLIEDVTKGKIKIVITTILQKGANLPYLCYWINAQGYKSYVNIKQRSGRIERKNDFKLSTCIIIEFNDQGKYMNKHYLERLELYKKENFEIKYID